MVQTWVKEPAMGIEEGMREEDGQQEKMNTVHLDIQCRIGVTAKAVRT